MPVSHSADPGQPGTTLVVMLPLIVLCLALAVACVVCAVRIPPHTALAWTIRALPLAACATLACLLLAMAPAAKGHGVLWALPLWLSPLLAGLGWALLPPPHDAGSRVARAVLLALPLMVALLTVAWSRLPPGLLRAAAAMGAPPGTRFWLMIRLWLPGAALACVPVLIVCAVLLG